MKQWRDCLEVATRGPGLHEITQSVVPWTQGRTTGDGLLTLFVRHTSASLLIQENADPDVRADLEDFFRRLVCAEPGLYRHDTEGLDDMPAHIRAALTQTHLAIPVVGGRPALGTWQGIFLYEHRDRPHRREIAMHLLGD